MYFMCMRIVNLKCFLNRFGWLLINFCFLEVFRSLDDDDEDLDDLGFDDSDVK